MWWEYLTDEEWLYQQSTPITWYVAGAWYGWVLI